MEIERKFLVDRAHSGLQAVLAQPGVVIAQGYLKSGVEGVVRVRRMGEKGYLTVKGPTVGISRAEFEYEIPVEDAQAMLDTLCEGVLVKMRHYHPLPNGLMMEVDVFAQLDLVLAEVELAQEEQAIALPAWITQDVSTDPSYYNNAILDRILATKKP
jgi:CYTH domain-containing protein